MDERRRDFIKLTAFSVSAAAAGSLFSRNPLAAIVSPLAVQAAEQSSSRSAAGRTFTASAPVSFEECQSLGPREMADRSPMVQASWRYLQEEIAKIRNNDLRALASAVCGSSAPRLAKMDPAARREVWSRLNAAGYTQQSEEHFLPPVPQDMDSRFPAVAAPGSGYGSHHAYPGGLVTHVAANVGITAAIVDTYIDVYGYKVNRDIAMTAQLLHDLHKPYVFQWREDSSSRTEQPLAGTGEHHVLSLAELLVRGAPAELVTAQACAHTHPGNEAEEAQVVGWLKAAAIIAGSDPVRYGLLEKSGTSLPLPRRQEGFLCHLGDHDFVLSVPAVQWTLPVMRGIARTDYGLSERDLEGRPFNSLRNMVYSQVSAMRLHQAYTGGTDAVRELMHSAVKPVRT